MRPGGTGIWPSGWRRQVASLPRAGVRYLSSPRARAWTVFCPSSVFLDTGGGEGKPRVRLSPREGRSRLTAARGLLSLLHLLRLPCDAAGGPRQQNPLHGSRSTRSSEHILGHLTSWGEIHLRLHLFELHPKQGLERCWAGVQK